MSNFKFGILKQNTKNRNVSTLFSTYLFSKKNPSILRQVNVCCIEKNCFENKNRNRFLFISKKNLFQNKLSYNKTWKKTKRFLVQNQTSQQTGIAPDWHFKHSIYVNKTLKNAQLERNEKLSNSSLTNSSIRENPPIWFYSWSTLFSNRHYWWSILPSSLLIQRLHWLSPNSNSLSHLKSVRDNLPDWLIEKQISWYWMLPFFGCLGLSLFSSNETILQSSSNSGLNSLQNSLKQMSDDTIKNKSILFNNELFLQNPFSWETLYYLDYQKSLFDTSLLNLKFKYVQNINYYHDKIRATIESKWSNKIFKFEEYNCTFHDQLVEKSMSGLSIPLENALIKSQEPFSFWENSVNKLISINNIEQSISMPSENSKSSFFFSVVKEEGENWWKNFIKSKSSFYWYWHNLKSDVLSDFSNTELYKNRSWIFMDEFAQKMLPTYIFSIRNICAPKNDLNSSSLQDQISKFNNPQERTKVFGKKELVKKVNHNDRTDKSFFIIQKKENLSEKNTQLLEHFFYSKNSYYIEEKSVKNKESTTNKLTAIYYPGTKLLFLGSNNLKQTALEHQKVATNSLEVMKPKFTNISSLNKTTQNHISSDFATNMNSLLTKSKRDFLLWNDWLNNTSNIYKSIGKEFSETDFYFNRIATNPISKTAFNSKKLPHTKETPLYSFQKALFFYENLINSLLLSSGQTFIKQKEEKTRPIIQKNPIILSGYQLPEYDNSDLLKIKKRIRASRFKSFSKDFAFNKQSLSKSQFLKMDIQIPPSALKIYARHIQTYKSFLTQPSFSTENDINRNQCNLVIPLSNENQLQQKAFFLENHMTNKSSFLKDVMWYEIKRRTEQQLSSEISEVNRSMYTSAKKQLLQEEVKDFLFFGPKDSEFIDKNNRMKLILQNFGTNNAQKDQNSFFGGSLLYLSKTKNQNSLNLIVGRNQNVPILTNSFQKKGIEKNLELSAKDSVLVPFNNVLKTTDKKEHQFNYINNWSFFFKYFTKYYGSNSLLNPGGHNILLPPVWPLEESSLFSTRPLKIGPEKLLKKQKLKLDFGENLLFKKWHSKRKEGFFYKTTNKMNFISNKWTKKQKVELLWGLRTNAKLQGFRALETTKYYQGKLARQNMKSRNNQNSDNDSVLNSNSKRNKVVRILLKRRRYRKVVSFENLCSWLRDALYFRKMTRQIVSSSNRLNSFYSSQNMQNQGSSLKGSNTNYQYLQIQDSLTFFPNQKMTKLVQIQNARPFFATNYREQPSLMQNAKNTENFVNRTKTRFFSSGKVSLTKLDLYQLAKRFVISNQRFSIESNELLKQNFSSAKNKSIQKLLPIPKDKYFSSTLIGNVNQNLRSGILIDYKPITFRSSGRKFDLSYLNSSFIKNSDPLKVDERIGFLIPGNESYLNISINNLNYKRNGMNSWDKYEEYDFKHVKKDFLLILSSWQKQIKIVLNYVLKNINNTYMFLNRILEKMNFYLTNVLIFRANNKNFLHNTVITDIRGFDSIITQSQKEPIFMRLNNKNEKSENLNNFQNLFLQLKRDIKWRNNINANWQRKINLKKTIWYPFYEDIPLNHKEFDWNRTVQNELLNPLLVQFKNLSGTLSIWRENFKISRDYTLLLNYIYFDHLGASLNRILKEFVLNQFSFIPTKHHGFVKMRASDSFISQQSIGKNITENEIETNSINWYYLNNKTENSFLSPSWSFKILNHLKTTHPSVYNQIQKVNSEKRNNNLINLIDSKVRQLQTLSNNLNSGEQSSRAHENENVMNDLLMNFTSQTKNTGFTSISSDLTNNWLNTFRIDIQKSKDSSPNPLLLDDKDLSITKDLYPSVLFLKNEKVRLLIKQKLLDYRSLLDQNTTVNTKLTQSSLNKSLFSYRDSGIISSSGGLLQKHFLNRSKKVSLMKRQQKFLRILQLVKKLNILSQNIPIPVSKVPSLFNEETYIDSKFTQRSIDSERNTGLQKRSKKEKTQFKRNSGILNSRSLTSTVKNRSYPLILSLNNWISQIQSNILKFKKGQISNQVVQPFHIFNNKKENRSSRVVVTSTFHNILVTTGFWFCAILFHMFLIFSLLTIYKTAFHFCIKCTFSIATLISKHFINLKQGFQRINKYIYQNTFKFINETLSQSRFISKQTKVLWKFCSYLTSFLFIKNQPLVVKKREIMNFSFMNWNKGYSFIQQENPGNLIFHLLQKNTDKKIRKLSIDLGVEISNKKDLKSSDFILNKTLKDKVIPTSQTENWQFIIHQFQNSSFKKFLFNLTNKLSEKETKNKSIKINLEFLKFDFLFLFLIGESQVLAELEPYREMHWYFLKKQTLIMRAPATKYDNMNMYDYQADEKIRKLQFRLRKSAEILSSRIDKTEKKYNALSVDSSISDSSKKPVIMTDTQQQQNGMLFEQKGVQEQQIGEKILLNSKFFIKQESIKQMHRTKKRLRNVRVWKPVFSFFGKSCLISRLIRFDPRFRQSLFLVDQQSSVWGPLGTLFLPFLIKQFAITFDTSSLQLKNRKFDDVYKFTPSAWTLLSGRQFAYSDVNKYKKLEIVSFLTRKHLTEIDNKLSGLTTKRDLSDEISKKILQPPLISTIDAKNSSKEWTQFLLLRIFNLLSTSQNGGSPIAKLVDSQYTDLFFNKKDRSLFNVKRLSHQWVPLIDRDMTRHLEKLVKKYSSLNLKEYSNTSLSTTNFLDLENRLNFITNITQKNNFEFSNDLDFLTKKTTTLINTDFSSIYQINTENSVSNRFLNLETYDPKTRFYRFFINLNKKFRHVKGLNSDYDVHNRLGPLVCKIYSGMFSQQSAKNLLLVGNRGRTDSVHLLVQAMAGETGFKLFMEDAKRLGRVGRRGINKSVQRLEKLFRIAQANVPCVVYLEDIDIIASKTRLAKVNEEYDDEDLAMRVLFSRLIYQKQHTKKSLVQSFMEQNLYLGEQTSLRRRSLLPESPIPKNLIRSGINRPSLFGKSNSGGQTNIQILPTLINVRKKLTPAFTTNAALIWKMFKTKIQTPHQQIKEAPWTHMPSDALRSIHPLTYSVKIKVLKLTLLAIYTMGTRLRLVKDLIRLFESLKSESYQGFVILATTNKLSLIDPSLRQPGRLEEIVYLAPLELVGRMDILNTYAADFAGFKKTFNIVNSALMLSLISNKNLDNKDSFQNLMSFNNSIAKGQDWEWDFVHATAKQTYESSYLENYFVFDSFTKNLFTTNKQNILTSKKTLSRDEKSLINKKNIYQKSSIFMLLKMSNQILSNMNFRFNRTDNSSYVSQNNQRIAMNSQTSFSNVNRILTKNSNFSNLSVLTSCAFSQAGKFILSFVFEQKAHKSRNLGLEKSGSKHFVYDLEMINGLHLWPFNNYSQEQKQTNKVIQRSKNFRTLKMINKYIAPKIGEFFLLSLSKKTNSVSFNSNNLVFGSQTTSSSILSIILTNNLYSKTTFLPRLFLFEDVSNQRRRSFSENINSSILFEYFNLNKPSFFNKMNLSLEENLQNQQHQKYFLNLENRPLRQYVRLTSTNRQALFHMLFNEFSSLDEISSRPTSMSYYYNRKIRLKQKINKFSYKWWNWHLKNGTEFLEEFQYLDSFPYADKHYNPRHRRWMLANGYWGYWFTYEKTLAYEIYEQWIVLAFNKLSNKLDSYRECLDFLSQQLIQKQVLTEVEFITIIKRFLF